MSGSPRRVTQLLMMLSAAAGWWGGAPATPVLARAPERLAERADPRPSGIDDPLVATLARIVDSPRDRTSVTLLAGLRRLRDPSLRPLFAQLASSDRSALRAQGILGLAELESPSRVDLLLVRALPEPEYQLAVLGEALRSGMLGDEQLEDVAGWPRLDPTMRALVLGELRRRGRLKDRAALLELSSLNTPSAATYAALELLEGWADEVSARRAEQALDWIRDVSEEPTPASSGDEAERRAAAASVLRYVAQYRVASALALVDRLCASPHVDDATRARALTTRLAISAEPSAGAAWAAWYRSSEPGVRARVAIEALELVAEGRPLPASVTSAITESSQASEVDPRLGEGLTYAGAASALLARSDTDTDAAVEALCSAVRVRSPLVAAWVLRLASGTVLPEPARWSALSELVRVGGTLRSGEPQEDRAAMAALAERAAEVLARAGRYDDLSALLDRAIADRHEPAGVAVLVGAISSGDPRGRVLAARVLGAPPTDVDPDSTLAALACLLDARLSEELTAPFRPALEPDDELSPDERRERAESLARRRAIAESLTRVATSPLVPERMRVQAAWLALRARGQERFALTRLLNEAAR